VLEGDGTPVPHTKIDYVDASTMKMNEKWTNNIGVSRLYVSGCEATLIVYSKKGDPTYQEVDLKDSKSGTKKVTVVLKNIGNFLVYINPTESDAYDITATVPTLAYKWKFEHVRYFYQSGSITGEGHAVGGLGAGPLAVRVEDGKDLKLMLTGQTGTIPAYLGLSSLDLSKSAETTMALPPFSVGGTKEFGVVVGCNMADISMDVSQDQVGSRPKLFDVFVYYVDRTAASPAVDRLVGSGLDWDCDIDTASPDDHCYTHHFNVSKAEYKTDRDYLFMVEFDTEGIKYRGNCYATDCNGKIKSTEIPSSVTYESDANDGFSVSTPVFYIGCICKGKLANYQSLGTFATYEADNSGTPLPDLEAFYGPGFCTECAPAPEPA